MALSTDAWSGKKNYEAYTPGMSSSGSYVITKCKNYNRENNIQKSWINRYSTVETSVVPKFIYGQHNPIQIFAEYLCVWFDTLIIQTYMKIQVGQYWSKQYQRGTNLETFIIRYKSYLLNYNNWDSTVIVHNRWKRTIK